MNTCGLCTLELGVPLPPKRPFWRTSTTAHANPYAKQSVRVVMGNICQPSCQQSPSKSNMAVALAHRFVFGNRRFLLSLLPSVRICCFSCLILFIFYFYRKLVLEHHEFIINTALMHSSSAILNHNQSSFVISWFQDYYSHGFLMSALRRYSCLTGDLSFLLYVIQEE